MGREVTLARQPLHVSQVNATALPVSYADFPHDDLEPFARLILEAAYEATLAAAVLNHTATGCDKLFLTLLGGGAFGNAETWVVESLQLAIERFADAPLRVAIVSFGRSNKAVRGLVKQWEAL